MTWEQKTIDIQGPSTKELMLAQNERPLEDDFLHIAKIRETPITKDAQCLKEDGSVDLNVREFTQKELVIEEKIRQERGEIIGKLRPEATASTLTEEKRERGSSAFMRALSVDALRHKFKMVMEGLFKPTHAEIMAESIRKAKDEN